MEQINQMNEHHGCWGGESHNNLLKSHYKKSLFALIKSAKRYYLGIWIIKLPFYALFSESKAKKWREKRTIRYENLRIAKKRFKGIRKLSPQIKDWVESGAFKEKYANHPYPPLLNLDSIPYESISAELAWDLNLPLPDNYKFIFLASHGVGRAATGSYLSTCGVPYFDELQNCKSGKDRYIANYDILMCSHKHSFNIITLAEYYPEHTKFLALLKKRPFLILVRDPISHLKTLSNHPHIWNIPSSKNYFTLQDKNFEVFSSFKKSPLNEYYMDIHISSIMPVFDKFTYKLIESDKTCIIQTDDIKPETAFETFKKLSYIFGFESPKRKDKHIFTTTFLQGITSYFLPIVLRVNVSDLSTKRNLSSNITYFDILISTDIEWNLKRVNCSNFKDITSFINLKQQAINNLCIKIEKNYFSLLQNDLLLVKKIKIYLEELLLALYTQKEISKKNLYTEQDILAYFFKNTNCRKKFKAHLDERVGYFKENHPDIVASWKYYNEFEKMCAELDSVESNPNKVDLTDKKEDST